jgi:uncharacterized protein with HEPN domain
MRKKLGAVERGFEIIPEASRGIPDELELRYGNIPWPAIARIGNHLKDRDWTIEPAILWKTALWHRPAPQEALQDMLQN